MEQRQIKGGEQENRIEERSRGNLIYDMHGLKLTLWGLIFTAINIRILGFDIVPDVIGYILVIAGLGKIEAYEEKFLSAKRMAAVLTVFALINIYQAPAQNTQEPGDILQPASESVVFSAGVFGAVPWLAALLMIAGMVANIYFAYFMCMGMKNLLRRTGDSPLAKICDDRWRLILASEIGLAVSLLTVLLGVPFGMAAMLIFGVLALVALILFLLLIHHAYKSIDGKEGIN